MDDHPRILQQLVQVTTFHRRRDQPRERVGGENQERQEADAHQPHDPEYACDHFIGQLARETRSEEHTSELQSLMRISYAVFCLKKKKKNKTTTQQKHTPRKHL